MGIPVTITSEDLALITHACLQSDRSTSGQVCAASRAREILKAAGLGPDGREKPLTVNGKPVKISTISQQHAVVLVTSSADGYAVPSSLDWALMTPAEQVAIQKALGLWKPKELKRTCDTCGKANTPCRWIAPCDQWVSRDE